MVGPMELGVYLPVCFSLSRKTREGDVKSRHFLPTLVLSPQHSGLGPRGGGGVQAEGPPALEWRGGGRLQQPLLPQRAGVLRPCLSVKTCQVTTDTLCGNKSGGSGCCF